jgi:hypothetical protein
MRTLLLLGVLFFSLNNAFAQEVKDTALRLDQYGKVVKRVPLGAEARNGILVFESADQDYKLWFDFRLNIDGQVTFGEKFNEIGDGASLRRARLAVKADISKNWYGELDLSFNNAKLRASKMLMSVMIFRMVWWQVWAISNKDFQCPELSRPDTSSLWKDLWLFKLCLPTVV